MIRKRRNQIMLLLGSMSSIHPEIVLRAKQELQEACGDCDSTLFLCSLMRAKKANNIRLNAATVLGIRLADPEEWSKLAETHRADLLTQLFDSLKSFEEHPDEALQLSILRNVGLAMLREQGIWAEAIFDFIKTMCRSVESARRRFGALVYSQLADVIPEIYANHMEWAQHIFLDGLLLARDNGPLVTPVTDHLLHGWTRAIVVGHESWKPTSDMDTCMPLVVRFIELGVNQANKDMDLHGYDLLRVLVQFKPRLVWEHLPTIMDMLITHATDINLTMPVRVKGLRFLGVLLLMKLPAIEKKPLMGTLLMTLHELIAVKPVVDSDGEEDYLGQCSEEPGTVSVSVEILRQVAEECDSNRLIARVLRLMRAHLATRPRPCQRMGVYIFLGVITETLRTQLRCKHLRRMLDMIENGFDDDDVLVKKSAYYSLTLIVEHLQPEVTQLASRLMPVYYRFFGQVLDSSQATIGSHLDSRLFYSLEILLQGLRPHIVEQYLPELVEHLLELLKPEVDSKFARGMSLSSLAVLGGVVREALDPFFEQIVDAVQPCLYFKGEEGLQLRSLALRVFAALGHVNRQKFTQLKPLLLDFVVTIMSKEPEPQAFTHSLATELCAAVPEDCLPHINLIVESAFKAIDTRLATLEAESEETALETVEPLNEDLRFLNTEQRAGSQKAVALREGDESDNEAVGGRDMCDMNSTAAELSDVREEAILCLKSVATHLPEVFVAHIMEVISRCFQCLEYQRELVSKAAFEVLTQCVVCLWQHEKRAEAEELCTMVLSKMLRHIKRTELQVVYSELDCISILLETLGPRAIGKPEHGHKIFVLLRNVLLKKLKCLTGEDWCCFDEQDGVSPDDPLHWSEMCYKEKRVVQRAKEVLPILGAALGPESFSQELKSFWRFVAPSRWGRQKPSDKECYFAGVIIPCLRVLGPHADAYYEILCRSISRNIRHHNAKERQCSFKSLGEMVKYVDRKPRPILAMGRTVAHVLRNNDQLFPAEKQAAFRAICHMITHNPSQCPSLDFMDLIFAGNLFAGLELPLDVLVAAISELVVRKPEAIQSLIPQIQESCLAFLEARAANTINSEPDARARKELLEGDDNSQLPPIG